MHGARKTPRIWVTFNREVNLEMKIRKSIRTWVYPLGRVSPAHAQFYPSIAKGFGGGRGQESTDVEQHPILKKLRAKKPEVKTSGAQ